MKILVAGAGVQGRMIVSRLNETPGVSEVISADYNFEAARYLAESLDKVTAVQVNAKNTEEIVDISKGADLLVNALPPDFNIGLMEAALQGNMHYQDLASGPVPGFDFVSCVKNQLELNQKFKDSGLTALINTGVAPGMVSVVARTAADKLDRCERISILIYEAVETRKYVPFWWSPETALKDMAAKPIVFEDGEYHLKEPFSDPLVIDFKGMGPRRIVNHQHEEVVTFPMFIPGLKYVNLKYGGPSTELAEKLYKIGLLDAEPVEINGCSLAPIDMVCKVMPQAPNLPNEIADALSEGFVVDEGAMLIRVEGLKDGKPVCIDNYINGPGLTECYEKYGFTHEAFTTGQSAFLFTKLFVVQKIDSTGVFPPEALGREAREYYLREAAQIGLTVDEVVESGMH
ncbi:MAG: hypothetical protein HN342_14640 [Nitrospina sp.]|nr:hypothetical protein [Nitrospina sp.]